MSYLPAVRFKASCPDLEHGPGQVKLVVCYNFPVRPGQGKTRELVRKAGGWNLKIASRSLSGRVLAINGNLV
ncbi:MAG TPA: hypothetical protein PLP94_04290 [Candidatus Saccharicenans sp.]|nr:hypothetical protein [Candidatus Saccharicenans sp.]HOL45829.1 hypothetical protein [Candidatus Saccharicenans sp.]HOM94301.1 hypothetical protein [Candidatus Saccharicenans sp.]HOP61476.1 hypothetical protein [Candidatus Saccharicenans sp.]HOT68766.1 hypothetical protein [Candidatus Saccharicenans sp.]